MLLRHKSQIYRALRSLRGIHRPVNLALPNLGPITAAEQHIRSFHSVGSLRSSIISPGDPLPKEVEILDDQEQAARNEIDIEIDELEPPSIIDAAAAALRLSSSSLGSSISRFSGPKDSVSRSVSTSGGGNMSFEIGRLARFADGACSARSGDTTVLATVTSSSSNYGRRDLRGVPFIVDYREKLYAVGRIPGTYNKREGTAKEHEMLASRRLERAIRPLLPRGYCSPIEITASVLSADGSADPEALSINAVSAAMATSDIPWAGPVCAARVALIGGNIVVNPRPDVNQRRSISHAGSVREMCS